MRVRRARTAEPLTESPHLDSGKALVSAAAIPKDVQKRVIVFPLLMFTLCLEARCTGARVGRNGRNCVGRCLVKATGWVSTAR